MKKSKFGFYLIAAVVFFVLFSCGNELLSTPNIPLSVVEKGLTAPEGLSASHGEKGAITLSWNQKPNATHYYIYWAKSPLDTFVLCGESTSNQFKHRDTGAGSTFYYRVTAVSATGEESLQSAYVKGTSLAQPWITDITDVNESSATVTWYMDNVADDTYKNHLLYTVYCYSGSTEIAQIALDGSVISENKAIFSGLSANTSYEYVVEAYLRSNQSVSEKSAKINAATARRFRPGQPGKFKAARGTAKDKIELSFELPDMVDIALGDNQYDPKPLYFVISKRRYSDNANANEYLKVCSYLGSSAISAVNNNGVSFNGYVPGALITWTDEGSSVSRGVEYEYLVQAYVDDTNRTISSDDSKSTAIGWALSEGNLSFKDINYTYAADGRDVYESATLPLDFDFDHKGEAYSYHLIEKIEPINDDDENDPYGIIEHKHHFATHEAIHAHVPSMDLTQKTEHSKPGRGVYSYGVEIRLSGADPESAPLDTIATIGKVEVSENTQPIIVEKFSVTDGFKDKFVLKWHNKSNRRYEIFVSDNRDGPWTSIGIVNPDPTDDENVTADENFEYIYSGQTAGDTKYFAVQPSRDLGINQTKKGQMVYAQTASQTLGVPQISLSGDGHSYGFITVAWTAAQKADTYRVKYWYTEDGGNYATAVTAATVKASALSIGADGRFKFQFSPFADNGYVADVDKSGMEIQVTVDALNEGLRAAVGGGEIATTSTEEVKNRLVGPARIGLSASKAGSAQEIQVSWNSISGADGYYVYRRQFNMTNAAEAGSDSVVYYVPASSVTASIDVTGKNLALDSQNSKIDTTMVKASAAFADSKYTLTDKSMPDSDYNGTGYNRHTPAYRDQQNDMAQGYPYRYYVVPVVNRGGAPESLTAIDFTYYKDGSNKNTSIDSYTIRENNVDIRYTGASALEQEGFTIGFGQEVTATKGTYASSGNVNNGIRITWSAPPRLSAVGGFSPRYTLYRRATSSSVWETVTSNIAAMEYVDNPLSGRGIAYEYVIGINDSQPTSFQRFVDLCYTMKDEKDRPNMLGFMLEMVKMESVSKDWREYDGHYAEEVRWYSAGIKTNASNDNNWGIDGYEIYVMNRNIDAGWHFIADVTNLSNQTNQNALVNNNGGLLKVMRDYKHFFKVRSYVKNSAGEKIYCPDPPYTYSADNWRNNTWETEYVKWGARQIGGDEFIRIVTLYMARGLDRVNGTAWNTAFKGQNAGTFFIPVDFNRNEGASTTYGGSGSTFASSNYGVSDWTIEYRNYKDDLQTKAGDWTTFITLNGSIRPFTNASNQYPQRYGYFEPVTVTGPADLPNFVHNGVTMKLYSGTFRFGTGGDLYWGNGTVTINYPTAGSGEQTISWTGSNTPMPYSGQGDRRYEQDAWK